MVAARSALSGRLGGWAAVALVTALALPILDAATTATADPVVTAVKGYACGYQTKVGLFGGPQATLGCAPQQGTAQVTANAASLSPSVTLPQPGGSATAI